MPKNYNPIPSQDSTAAQTSIFAFFKKKYSAVPDEVPSRFTREDYALAIGGNDLKTVKACMAQDGIWVNRELNDYKQMALHIACRLKQFDMLDFLVAEIGEFKLSQMFHVKDKLGFTPLDYLAFHFDSQESFAEFMSQPQFRVIKNATFNYPRINKIKDNLTSRPFGRWLSLIGMVPQLMDNLHPYNIMQNLSEQGNILSVLAVAPRMAQGGSHQASSFYHFFHIDKDKSFIRKVMRSLDLPTLVTLEKWFKHYLIDGHKRYHRNPISKIKSPLTEAYLYYEGLLGVNKSRRMALKKFQEVPADSRDYPYALYFMAKMASEDESADLALPFIEIALQFILKVKVFGPRCSQYHELEKDLITLKNEVAASLQQSAEIAAQENMPTTLILS